MKLNPSFLLLLARRSLAIAGFFGCAVSLLAQNVGTGTVEGRVFDAGRGEFLEKAHVTIEGTTQETFTDSAGQFRLNNVPAGEARVKIFFTGLQPQTNVVSVAAGQTVQHDITLTTTATAPSKNPRTTAGDTVKLDQF